MPDTHHPERSQKLGGIPVGQTPGVYRKPPAFKMQPILRPAEESAPRSEKSKAPRLFRMLLAVVVLGGGVFMFVRMQPALVTVFRKAASWRPHFEKVVAEEPQDTSPIATPSFGWTLLFSEPEWRATDSQRECKRGLLHLRGSLQKPQPEADGAIRARILIREEVGSASVVLRNTLEGGRYRLAIDPDLRFVRLVHEDAKSTHELGKYRLYKELVLGERVLLELRAEGDKLVGLVNDATVIEAKDKRSTSAGTWGIEAGDAWFELVEVPVPKEKPVVEAPPVESPLPAPAAEPAPAMPVAAPAPATPAPPSETAKWLASLDAQWQENYSRTVTAPFDKGVADLKKQYIATLEPQLAAATQARKLDEAAFFRGELKRTEAGEDVPEKDEAIVPAALKQLRAGYRASFARLDIERFNHAKALHAKYDAILAQNQTALTQRQRTDEVGEIKIRRDKLRAAWLKPPASSAPAPASATPAATPAPKPALGATTSPPAAAVKLPPRQVVEKLLAMGAGVWVNQRGNANAEIKTMPDLFPDKFTFTRVDFHPERPDQSPITTADLEILGALGELHELELRAGPALTDTAFGKLRGFRNLRRLALDGAGITTASYAVLATLPELRDLELRALATNDEAMKTVGQLHRLQRLVLAGLPIGDEALAGIGKMVALEELDLSDLEKLTAAGVAHLAECHALRRLNLGGLAATSAMIESVARCNALESFSVSGDSLTDASVASLGTLTKLRNLNLGGTSVSGSGFARWPVRTSLVTLNLPGEPGVNDEALKGIANAFPRLEQLNCTAASGLTAAGIAPLEHLRKLRILQIAGEAVKDEAAILLGKCDSLEHLNIAGAHLTDAGAAALGKLPRLAYLDLNQPPVTDAALKSFARCKTLKNIHIGQDAPPQIEEKLKAALPGVAIHR